MIEDQRTRHRYMSRHLATSGRWHWRQGQIDPAEGPPVPLDDQGHRRWSSRQLHRLGDLTSHAWAGAAVLIVVLGWIAYGGVVGFPRYWQSVLESVASVITLIMVFAIQHLQARNQTVIQRKLDELLRASPAADNRVIAIEEASDEELEVLTELNHQDRLG